MESRKILNNALLIVLISIAPFVLLAQKLPNKQEVGLRAPADIKIDGKTTEWGGKFQAYNKATDIFYTISNDDENLYLTVQAKYDDVKNLIISGGITFSVSQTLSKSDKALVTLTYPVLRDADMSTVSNFFARKSMVRHEANNAHIDVDDLNKALDAKSKVINISGIKAIPDESISVYNNVGIKAVSQFDNQLNYTYELAIPLKYLSLANNGTERFSYHIKVNDPAEVHITSGKLPPPVPVRDNAPGPVATDFWGEYVLEKK